MFSITLLRLRISFTSFSVSFLLMSTTLSLPPLPAILFSHSSRNFTSVALAESLVTLPSSAYSPILFAAVAGDPLLALLEELHLGGLGGVPGHVAELCVLTDLVCRRCRRSSSRTPRGTSPRWPWRSPWSRCRALRTHRSCLPPLPAILFSHSSRNFTSVALAESLV